MMLFFYIIFIYLIFIKWIVIEVKKGEPNVIKKKNHIRQNHSNLFFNKSLIELYSDYFSNKYVLFIIPIVISIIVGIYYFSNNVKDEDNINKNISVINKDEIINNFSELYNFTIMNYEIFKNLTIKKFQTNYYSFNNESLINSNIINISQKNISKSVYLNISSIENFLINWQNNENKNSTFCFCPIFLGIINNNILFMFNQTLQKWVFLINYKFIEENEKNLKSKIIFNNETLQKFYTNFKMDPFIIHSENSILEYEEFKNESINKIRNNIYSNDISCILHCKNLNKDLFF